MVDPSQLRKIPWTRLLQATPVGIIPDMFLRDTEACLILLGPGQSSDDPQEDRNFVLQPG